MAGCLGFRILVLPDVTEHKWKNQTVQPIGTNLLSHSPSFFFFCLGNDLGATEDVS